MTQFMIIALPRSRTKWLSKFLSYGGKKVGHDLIVDCASVSEFAQVFAQHDGSCETGAVVGWRRLRHELPNLKIIVIKRSAEDVAHSLVGKGFVPDPRVLIEREIELEELSQQPGVLSFDFDQLDEENVCKEIFEQALELKWDRAWWLAIRHENIQVDFSARLAVLSQNAARLVQFTQEVMR